MRSRAGRFEPLHSVLVLEDAVLQELVALARQQQSALIRCDYPAIDSFNDRMLAVSDRLEELAARREAAIRSIGCPGMHLEEICDLAEDEGIAALRKVQLQLLRIAAQLQDVQEQNATLVLNALRLRERWMAMIASRAEPTYSGSGARLATRATRFISRSA